MDCRDLSDSSWVMIVIGYRGKRLLDILLVCLTTPVWIPVLGMLAGLVRYQLGSPVFFRQLRPGLHGHLFWLLKFRTMTDARDNSGAVLPDSARLTGFGSWLRSTSLDELPELLNVLRGEMSLVGPRPLLPQYLPRYSLKHRGRHNVRPGITGLAQVSGRNALSWPARLDLDIEYVNHCTLRWDVIILARTVKTVFSRSGISSDGSATMSEFLGYTTEVRADQ